MIITELPMCGGVVGMLYVEKLKEKKEIFHVSFDKNMCPMQSLLHKYL